MMSSYTELESLYGEYSSTFDSNGLIDGDGSIENALWNIEQGAEFSFFDLGFPEDIREELTHLDVSEFINVNFTVSSIYSPTQGLNDIFEFLMDKDVSKIVPYVSHVIKNIMISTSSNHADVVVRAIPPYSQDCATWHIDKDHMTILEGMLENTTSLSFGNTRYIIPLFGEGTLFYPATSQQKEQFYLVANETNYLWGHNVSCSQGDTLNDIFNVQDAITVPDEYGSIHKVMYNGTVHDEPIVSVYGRSIIVVTPFNKFK